MIYPHLTDKLRITDHSIGPICPISHRGSPVSVIPGTQSAAALVLQWRHSIERWSGRLKGDEKMFFEEIIGAFTGRNRRTRHRQVCLGITLGAIGGAVLGLLFAPQAGKETREQIAKPAVKGAKAVKEYSVKAGKAIKEKTEETAEAVAKKARGLAREARLKEKEGQETEESGEE